MQQTTDPLYKGTETVPCKYCQRPTLMLNTRMCDRCWELETRIKAYPELAVSIMALNTEFIPVSISESYIKVLTNWASISRTLMEAGRLLERYVNLLEKQHADIPLQYSSDARREELQIVLSNQIDRVDHNIEEIDTLTIPLDALHQSWRTKQWLRERFLKKADKPSQADV